MNLIIGTANFSSIYRGHLVSKDEQNKIWDYCREVGIDTVDTATAYGEIEIPDDFKVITKITSNDVNIPAIKCDVLMVHHRTDWEDLGLLPLPDREIESISIYSPTDLLNLPLDLIRIIQLPINPAVYELWTNDCVDWLKEIKKYNVEIHARSIFGGGEFVGQFGLGTCLRFVTDIPEVDSIVIGIENCEQLKEIVECLAEGKKRNERRKELLLQSDIEVNTQRMSDLK